MSAEIIDINLEGDSNGNGNEVRFLSTNILLRCVKVMLNGWGCLVIVLVSDECTPGDDANKGQEIDNGSKGVETKGLTHGKGVDGEVRVEESQKESVVEDYYEPGQDFTTKGVWLEKEDEAGVEKEDEVGVEKERAVALKSDNVADDHNDDLYGTKRQKVMKGIMILLWISLSVNAASPSTPLTAIHDNNDEMQSDAEYSYISTEEDDGSDADHASRRRATHAVYEEVEDAFLDIRLGMIFVSKAHFKAAVDRCNTMQRRDIKWKKNDNKRIRAVYKYAPSCDWKILLSKDAVTDSWMVKTDIHEHTCGEELTSRRFNSRSASKYLVKKMGFASLYLKANDIFQTIRRNIGLELIGKQCKKAREKIARVFEGNCLMEYSKLWDCAAELRRRDPVATILIQAPRPTTNANPIFMRTYVCFSAMKLGFVAGCRCLIGVDGAFLKGAYKGVLLVAVGRDANDQMYPLAWAAVDVEKIETWRWFSEKLQSDMQIGSGNRFTFILDQQKRAFWKCAKATTEADFIKALGELTNIKQRARAAVLKVHPQFWSKAFFKEDSKSYVVDNNMCEVFNGLIVDSRHKAIFSMLEDLRMMCGRRTVARRTFADEKFVGDFGPKIWEKIVASREGSKRCRVLWPGGAGYEVEEEDKGKFIVDRNRRTCTYRCWNMTSIPCKHVIEGMPQWKETRMPPIQPPLPRMPQWSVTWKVSEVHLSHSTMSNLGFLPTNIPHILDPTIFNPGHVHQRYFQPSDYDLMIIHGSEEDNTIGFNVYPSQIDHVKPQEIIPNIPIFHISKLPWSRSEVQEEEIGMGRGMSEMGCRIAFRTESDLEIMDDGFKWKKYGRKKVKNNPNPRHYYKCSSDGCNVKKRGERDREDSRLVITTYEGVHNHQTPCAN
ncbi:hypothetical protein SLEP1_g4721 [Rubroshorea leprosula]|uniref:WRKY domain-containing protein n=1 Tax=Rubroshorea leprosula TaxID=152421 RepID=A0AAV5HVK0_9ROSI|nr:hypothetical protein SLEP1_g4721 [Rubroshorea leprosula]